MEYLKFSKDDRDVRLVGQISHDFELREGKNSHQNEENIHSLSKP